RLGLLDDHSFQFTNSSFRNLLYFSGSTLLAQPSRPQKWHTQWSVVEVKRQGRRAREDVSVQLRGLFAQPLLSMSCVRILAPGQIPDRRTSHLFVNGPCCTFFLSLSNARPG